MFISITRQAKRSCYEILDPKDITDSEKFWATIKPLYSNKVKPTEYIPLEENVKIISNYKELATIFFFFNGNEHLHIKHKNNSHLAP